jgi:ArsR family transcriptional regulator, cadmium/lead-responsive transcriptional repressor
MVRPDLAARSPHSSLEDVHSKFFAGLADPTRLRIVRLLLGGPRSVGEIVAQLGASQSGVSNHLACLKWCGYVSAKRRGRSVFYRLSDVRVRSLLNTAESIVSDNARRLATCTRIRPQTRRSS